MTAPAGDVGGARYQEWEPKRLDHASAAKLLREAATWARRHDRSVELLPGYIDRIADLLDPT